MKLLIKQATVADPSSPFNGQTVDLFIQNGQITGIGKLKNNADRVIDAGGLFVSPGWVDVFANFADPGYEFKETLESGAAAAAAGGFTDVILVPNTNPPVHNKSGVEYLVQKSRSLPVAIHPAGAITKNAEGRELAEMYDMRASGAVAFTDGTNPVQSAGLLLKALQYVKAFGGVLIQIPDDRTINPQGLMNEGIVSTRMGLPGKPALAEELLVERDIRLADYAGSRIHFTGISTAHSVDRIEKARKDQVGVSCSVSPQHLFFSEEDLEQYDTNFKLDPPLRGLADRDALREALASGKIDCIASHHFPQEADSKVLEFEYARPGMISLETTYAAVQTAVPGLAPPQLAELFSLAPRRIFGLPVVSIKEQSPAILSFFDPRKKWEVQPSDLRSKSKNSAYLGKELTGKVAGIIRGDFCTL